MRGLPGAGELERHVLIRDCCSEERSDNISSDGGRRERAKMVDHRSGESNRDRMVLKPGMPVARTLIAFSPLSEGSNMGKLP